MRRARQSAHSVAPPWRAVSFPPVPDSVSCATACTLLFRSGGPTAAQPLMNCSGGMGHLSTPSASPLDISESHCPAERRSWEGTTWKMADSHTKKSFSDLLSTALFKSICCRSCADPPLSPQLSLSGRFAPRTFSAYAEVCAGCPHSRAERSPALPTLCPPPPYSYPYSSVRV